MAEPSGRPDAEIHTSARVWRAIDAGRMSGIEAFTSRTLSVRGSIEHALVFETLFERPDGGGLRYYIDEIETDRRKISVLVAGQPSSSPLLLLHGLGGTKASWLRVLPSLARSYRVIAVDFPGFGASSKPHADYNAPFLAGAMFDLLDELGHEDAFIAGNSMGGRVAIEMAMLAPERVNAIACLCPAAAFSSRPLLWFARMARVELGIAAPLLPRRYIHSLMRQFFSDPGRIDEAWYDAAFDDFSRGWKSPAARVAFFSAARNIYLDEGSGESGFWTRLASMEPPALFIYGVNDRIISPHFSHRVRAVLPRARVEIWNDCGHVPQLEHPQRAARAMDRFFESCINRQQVG